MYNMVKQKRKIQMPEYTRNRPHAEVPVPGSDDEPVPLPGILAPKVESDSDHSHAKQRRSKKLKKNKT